MKNNWLLVFPKCFLGDYQLVMKWFLVMFVVLFARTMAVDKCDRMVFAGGDAGEHAEFLCACVVCCGQHA